MRVIEKTHPIDLTIDDGSEALLPLIKAAYPDANIIDDNVNVHDSDWYKKEKKDSEEHPWKMIQAYRWKKGLTQAKLADKAGMRRESISLIENGKRPIGLAVAKKLASALGVDYQKLL